MSHSYALRHRSDEDFLHDEEDHSHHPVKRRHRRPAAKRADYTLNHAGRQLRIGPIAFWATVGALVIMATWSLVTATYFAFRDDVLTRLITRQAEMQYAYEDRIAELRSQVDRLTSRQLLDQEQFEQKLDQLSRRQSTLESRSSTISSMADPSPTGSVKSPARTTNDGNAIGGPKPSPISDTIILVPPADREARLESRVPVSAAHFARTSNTSGSVEAMMARLHESLDSVELRQTAALNKLEENFDARARRMRGVLADLGLDAGKPSAATGGPFVPVKPHTDASSFDRQLYRISIARAQVDRLNRVFTAVPIRKPLPGELETSSGFGVRMDPFIRSPAMHTGLDFRATYGDAVRATANGKVTSAGWNGGYGKMVEVDHGNGLATRYGHLSAIDVEEGQTIRIGQIVGRVGSTGRSTGPHLHYETRIDGDAVDPQKFLRAALRVGTL